MTVLGTEPLDLIETLSVSDLGIACDFIDIPGWPIESHTRAQWVMIFHCEACHRRVPYLACTVCKELVLGAEDYAIECNDCGHVVSPPRRAVSSVVAL